MSTRNKKGQFKKAAKASRVAGTPTGGTATPSNGEPCNQACESAAPEPQPCPPKEIILHLTKMRLARDLSDLEEKAKFAQEQHDEYMHQLSNRWTTVNHELTRVKQQLIEALG